MLLPTHTHSFAESVWDTYVLLCPWCDEALFHLELVPDTPFVTQRPGDPTIQAKDGELFCVCPQCAMRVEVHSEGGAVQIPERAH